MSNANLGPKGHLYLTHLDPKGRVRGKYDWGEGTVTMAFVNALILDNLGTGANKGAPALGGPFFMLSGNSSTAETQIDWRLGTTVFGSNVVPTVTASTTGYNGQLEFQGTITYSTLPANPVIAEWGLFTGGPLVVPATPNAYLYTNTVGNFSTLSTTQAIATANTGTPNAGSTPNLYAGCVLVDTTATTTIAATILTSNTYTTLTTLSMGISGWYTLETNGGAASGPPTALTDNLRIFPLMIDHKASGSGSWSGSSAAGAITLRTAGDSIAFDYILTFPSGG